MAAITYVCPNCGCTEFDKNPRFFECCDCGMRFVARADGSLQRTTFYGEGPGSRARGAANTYVPQNPANGSVNYNVNNTYNTVYVQQPAYNQSFKNRWIALILCFFFGIFGVHYFYLGRPGMGVLYLLTLGLFGFGWFVDLLRILLHGIKDGNGYMVI